MRLLKAVSLGQANSTLNCYASRMFYPKFLEQLLETGTVSIETPDRPSDQEVKQGVEILEQFDKSWRLEWASIAPSFAPAFASWAGESLYRACQLLVHRDLPVEPPLVSPCPDSTADKARQHYNVDLTFRFLPQLWRFTHREAEDDLLTEIIRGWCFRWPLSSVGAVNLTGSDMFLAGNSPEADPADQLAPDSKFPIQEFWSHPSLAQAYVDRIIEHKDRSRCGPDNPEVIERILAVAGDHLELFQSIQSNLMIKEPIKDEV